MVLVMDSLVMMRQDSFTNKNESASMSTRYVKYPDEVIGVILSLLKMSLMLASSIELGPTPSQVTKGPRLNFA